MRLNSLLQKQEKRIDLKLLLTVIILTGFGLLMVYDASIIQAMKDFGDGYYYIKQQLIWIISGVILLSISSIIDYRKLKLFAVPILIISFVLMIAVFIPGFGVSGGGAHRWLRIGGVTIQPAEIIKLTAVIFFAAVFEKKARFLPFMLVVLFSTVIIGILQRDLGSAIVFDFIAMIMYFVSGAPLRYFFALIPFGAGAFLLLILSSSYRLKRILAFLDPFSDTQGYTYHISQILIGLGSGGFFGLGFSSSRQKFYIPEVHTDSIFGVIGEETGFLGSVIIISLFAFLIFKGINIAKECTDNFGKLLATGLISWLGIQTVINLSAMVALMPLTGVPLPFISYGGSALLANLVSIGILLNISKRR